MGDGSGFVGGCVGEVGERMGGEKNGRGIESKN